MATLSYLLAPAVLAAIVAAIVSILTTRWRLREEFRKDVLTLKQTQLRDVLAQRMAAYPKIWKLIQGNVSDRRIERKLPSAAEVTEFLSRLNACHAEFGVFFSEPVYETFFRFRDRLIKLHERVDDNNPVTWRDVEALDLLWSGDKGTDTPGLATKLKDDLGSYEVTAFQYPSRHESWLRNEPASRCDWWLSLSIQTRDGRARANDGTPGRGLNTCRPL
jgi:hypothetical protein